MKTLITHINPHLDDIFAIWLLKKYDPKFRDFEIDFISASHDQGNLETAEKVYVGTGGGKFDEHKEGLATCAGSLVFDYLAKENLLPVGLEVKALESMVEWNRQIDMGLAPNSEFGEFSIQAFVRSKDSKKDSSLDDVSLGRKILDRVFVVQIRTQQSFKDWENRVEFETKFGKTFAIKSNTVDRPFCKMKGGDLFLLVSPQNNGVQFFTPSHEIDLSAIYKKLKQIDSEADWFLHQSHHMVLCGSSAAPEAKQTSLSFEELIEVTKSV